MTTELDIESFATAYVAGNKNAQSYQYTTAFEWKGAYQIADDLGYDRDSIEWDAAVAGASAFFFNAHRF